MAAKKKAKKNRTKSKRTAVKKVTPRKKTARKKLARKKAPRKLPKKKAAQKKPAAKTRAAKTVGRKTARTPKKPLRKKSQSVDTVEFPLKRPAAGSAGQSGDLQGLSRRAGADSESVDELLEEGNAFEAEAVSGVEEADAADEEEVHTHELPEDDVPEEYLDKD
jgi:hypothetical protein